MAVIVTEAVRAQLEQTRDQHRTNAQQLRASIVDSERNATESENTAAVYDALLADVTVE